MVEFDKRHAPYAKYALEKMKAYRRYEYYILLASTCPRPEYHKS